MIAAYIGCILIAAGSMIVLIEPFTSFRNLPQKHQDIAKAIGVGLIGIGTLLTLHSTVEDFASQHRLLASLGLLFVIVVGGIVIALPRFLTRQVPHSDDGIRDEQKQECDQIGDADDRPIGDAEDRPGNKQEDDHQEQASDNEPR